MIMSVCAFPCRKNKDDGHKQGGAVNSISDQKQLTVNYNVAYVAVSFGQQDDIAMNRNLVNGMAVDVAGQPAQQNNNAHLGIGRNREQEAVTSENAGIYDTIDDSESPILPDNPAYSAAKRSEQQTTVMSNNSELTGHSSNDITR